MRFVKWMLFFLLSCSLTTCGGENTTGGTETGNTVGAAVASLFASQTGNSSLIALVAKEAGTQTSVTRSACNTMNEGSDVQISFSVEPGTYGVQNSLGNFVTLTAADGCDPGGTYASFKVTSHEMRCTGTDGTELTATMENSTGVFTRTESATEIYGSFMIRASDGSTSNLQCHLTVSFDSSGDNFFAICADSVGNPVDQATDTTCVNAH